MALRVLAPNAIRPIEDLVPLLYPGVKVSYGTIQHMLVEAEARAARLNAQASLGGVEAGALDEMFSQGEPVLAGVDLDSGYLFGLSLSATRDGDAWAQLLREGQCQGLELSVVVKDAAKGIAAGVSEVFPRCCRSHYFVGDFSVYSWSTEARFCHIDPSSSESRAGAVRLEGQGGATVIAMITGVVVKMDWPAHPTPGSAGGG